MYIESRTHRRWCCMCSAGHRATAAGQNRWCQAFFSMLATTTEGRAKELEKQGLSDRNSAVAFWKSTRSGLAKPLVWRSALMCFSSSGLPLEREATREAASCERRSVCTEQVVKRTPSRFLKRQRTTRLRTRRRLKRRLAEWQAHCSSSLVPDVAVCTAPRCEDRCPGSLHSTTGLSQTALGTVVKMGTKRVPPMEW